MRKIILGLAVVAPLFVVAPASAQQIVDTTTGTQYASGRCAVSQAILAAINQGQADRQADTRTRVNAFLDNALASSRTRARVKTEGQSPVVFPPIRFGS